MARNKNLAATLIEDYVDMGFGTKVSELSMRSFDGETELELDSIDNEAGTAIGIEVFSNGTSVAELMYDDEEMNAKLFEQVKSALNI